VDKIAKYKNKWIQHVKRLQREHPELPPRCRVLEKPAVTQL